MRMIGLTPTLSDETKQITINSDYTEALRRAGALPVLLPLRADEEALREMLSRVDGLLLTGGVDIAPEKYGEEKLPCCGAITPLRDDMELPLCRLAVEMNMPVLAICRGHQVLNCALGGTLYQDIAAQYGTALKHPRHDAPREPVHTVKAAESSLLEHITGMKTLQVNSRHHQAVKGLGQGLIATGWAEDGLIEAIEMPGKKFVLGVQWHPESLADRRSEALAIFQGFVRACGGKHD